MGNRAVITTEDKKIGVYLHWNGGRDSVEAFLTYCKIKDFRSPETDSYGWARLCQVIANFFGGDGLSIGIDEFDKLDCDNHDNGVYIIKNWEIIGREYAPEREQKGYNLLKSIKFINSKQPENMQITDEQIENYIK